LKNITICINLLSLCNIVIIVKPNIWYYYVKMIIKIPRNYDLEILPIIVNSYDHFGYIA